MDLRLHHIGIVAEDISKQRQVYQDRFGYDIESDVIHDLQQTAFVQFLKLPKDEVYLEFVSPDRPESKLTQALNSGVGLHHLCYVTDSLDDSCRQLRERGMTLVRPPREAPAFQGRRIAWLMGRDRVLIELVEHQPGEGLPAPASYAGAYSPDRKTDDAAL